jgi:hypothetical protein
MLGNFMSSVPLIVILLPIFVINSMPRSNEGMRLIFSAVVGVMLGYLFGISFPTVNITKVNWHTCLSCFCVSYTCFREGGKHYSNVACSFTSLRVSSLISKIGTLASQPRHCWTMLGHLQTIIKRIVLNLTLMKFPRYFNTLLPSCVAILAVYLYVCIGLN